MKKNDLKKIAIAGLVTGVVISSQLQAATATADKNAKSTTADKNDGNMGYHLMSEEDLLLELNPEGIALYKSLSPENKALAREVASMRCMATNRCAGLGACQTDKNSCAGKNSCEGKGKCAIADKNLAVKLVAEKAKKMADKRSNVTK